MKVKCEYCDSFIDDTLEKCPNCGAPNEHMMRSGNNVPKTVTELLRFCDEKEINTERMHFYIGTDYKGPKAFGIYKDGDDFVVYKNKSDGSRAERYRGSDEAYAVNEIYQKLKERLSEAKQGRSAPAGSAPSARKNKNIKRPGCLIAVIILIIMCIVASMADDTPKNGYYSYGGSEYAYDDGNWYLYDNGAWTITDAVDELQSDYRDYSDDSYDGVFYDGFGSYYGDSGYNNDSGWNDDWDDDDWDYDWGNDSFDWDSGGDWDSDW